MNLASDRLPASCVLALFPLLVLALISAAYSETVEKKVVHGPVEVTATLDPAASTIGDPVTLTLRAVAEKNVELLMPDFGEALERFLILDFIQRDEVDDTGRTIMEQVYVLDPPRSGAHAIPPIMVEFVDRRPGKAAAPENLDAYEVLTERLPFEVASALPTDASTDLHDPFAALPPRVATTTGRGRLWLTAAAVLMLLCGLAWPLWARARRRMRRRTAYELAMARLARLAAMPRDNATQLDAFFVELSAIVRWYVENRFELRAPESTTEEFLAAMSRSPDLSKDHQTLLRAFLRRADLVKFAHFVPSDDEIAHSATAAQQFLEETRHAAPLLDPAATEPTQTKTTAHEVARA